TIDVDTLPRDADRRLHVLGADHDRHPGKHAYRRIARRLPRILRWLETGCHHGPDEILMKPGDRIPDLKGSSTTGDLRLRDFKGRYVVVYFYPKDNTPGCTREAQDFRDLAKKFAKANAVVLGVSRDSMPSHEKFRDK